MSIRNDLLNVYFARKLGYKFKDGRKGGQDIDWSAPENWSDAALLPPTDGPLKWGTKDSGWGSKDDDWGIKFSRPTLPGTRIRASNSNLGRRTDLGRPRVSLGWHVDVPDWRDEIMFGGIERAANDRKRRRKSVRYVKPRKSDNQAGYDWCRQLEKSKKPLFTPGASPNACLNIDYCSPIEDQGELGSCTAQAVVGLMEYMMRRGGDSDFVDGSRLFLYKVTRNLLGWTGDTGAYVRTALKAARAFGIAPEEYWPYLPERFDDEPSQFLYSFAGNYKAMRYARVDRHDSNVEDTIDHLERLLSTGFATAFGFSVYDTLTNEADIPFPDQHANLQGGHAVLAVGYDRNHEVDGKTVPSLIIRNSWGEGWGVRGYGYLSYDYIQHGVARDFWTVYNWNWIEGFG